MIAIILYLVSLGLFWVASMVTPVLFIPFMWLIKAASKDSIPASRMLPFVHLVATILLLYFTQYIWSLLGFKIGWFPVLVALQNFIASRHPMVNPGSKSNAIGIVIGSIIFLVLNALL